MKIALLSDLHNESCQPGGVPGLENGDADVIILAGDIDVGLNGIRWAVEQAERLDKRLLYVAGNHEFYHHEISLLDEMRELLSGNDRVDLLERDQIVIDGVRFLGCTLWTDYLAVEDREASMAVVERQLNDHRVISNGDQPFLPGDALKIHIESRAWLERELQQPFDGKTVVVTHHAPHLQCKHPDFALDSIATAFISDLSPLVEQADIWCYGHTHANLDLQLGGCRLLSNQRGYPSEGVEGFNPFITVTV